MTPLVLDLLSAARVDRSPDTGRCTLVDVFHTINPAFPARLTFDVYFVLTGLHGPADLSVEFLAPDDSVTCHGPMRIADPDPLAVASASATFTNVAVAGPGTCRVRVVCEGLILAERPILVGGIGVRRS